MDDRGCYTGEISACSPCVHNDTLPGQTTRQCVLNRRGYPKVGKACAAFLPRRRCKPIEARGLPFDARKDQR